MGSPMAGNLLKAGYRLTVYDTRRDAMEAFAKSGARAASSPADVAASAETVLLSLPTPDIVRAVALGDNGVIHASAVKTLIDLSTTGPRMAQQVAAGLAEKNIQWVDAPVSGGVSGAVKATLAVMVSCPRDVYERLESMLKVIGNVFYIGAKPGMGQTMKLINNLLSATAMAATSEAVVIGAKAGLDSETMIKVINAGSGMNTASRDKFPKVILPRTFDYGFSTGLMYKDLKLCLDEAEALGVPLLVANAVKQLWFHVLEQYGAESDFSNVVQIPEQWAGVKVSHR
jgi:3-hydroxyisobutyrate dehydrogenase-like beta-hydroxyacid dehydrogenase